MDTRGAISLKSAERWLKALKTGFSEQQRESHFGDRVIGERLFRMETAYYPASQDGPASF